jgi:hypothetical protein
MPGFGDVKKMKKIEPTKRTRRRGMASGRKLA